MNEEKLDLLNAVDALTKPLTVVEWQEKDGKRTIFKRVDEPLLEQLRVAIHSNIGGGGGGKPARERTPLDVGAFALYEDIDGRIRSWMGEMGGKVGKSLTPVQVLRTWYTLWTSGQHEPQLTDSYTRAIEGWGQQIKDKLDPPPSFEITSKCPVCGQEWIIVGVGESKESVRVLSAVERENMDDSYAVCRACNKVWRGIGQMRQLRILIDDMDTANQEKGMTA